jgi:UDP-N-acetylglucosamine transferase subunit ALG13
VGGRLKIFVTVGTHPQPFNRLLAEMERLVESKRLKASVFAQTGNSSFTPKFGFKRFLGEAEFEERFAWADIVVGHGGAGTIINAMRFNKKLVVVPRLQQFGEHTNDHQLDLAEALETQGKCIAVHKIRELGNAIERAGSFKPKAASNRRRLVARVARFLNTLH